VGFARAARSVIDRAQFGPGRIALTRPAYPYRFRSWLVSHLDPCWERSPDCNRPPAALFEQ